MFIRPPWNVATPGTFSTPEKNISNEEKSLKFLKNKKLEDNKKTSAELSRLADRINSNKSVINDSVRGSKSDVIVPQYSSHNFDLSRLHDDLCDQFGAEDPGAPREWLVPFLSFPPLLLLCALSFSFPFFYPYFRSTPPPFYSTLPHSPCYLPSFFLAIFRAIFPPCFRKHV